MIPHPAPAGGTTCPICGRYQRVWLDAPPTGCLETGGHEICATERRLAQAAAIRRRTCPAAFDANGNLLPDALPVLIEAMEAAGLNPMTGEPL